MKNQEEDTQIVEFHIGRGGRFYNGGHLTFSHVGNKSKNFVEEENIIAFENQLDVISHNEDVEDIIDLITDLDLTTETEDYLNFCKKYGDLGKLVLNSCDGNHIGDLAEDGDKFYYSEDGIYNTTYGVAVSCFEDLTDKEQEAVKNAQNSWEFEQAFSIDFSEMEDEE